MNKNPIRSNNKNKAKLKKEILDRKKISSRSIKKLVFKNQSY